MYGQYTKDLGDFARKQAARVKLKERRYAKKTPKNLTPLDEIKSKYI